MIPGDDLADWRRHHAGDTMIVCGCGTSPRALTARPAGPVIGVNESAGSLVPTTS